MDRARLRHRVVYTKSFVGVTGDRKHDSYSMRYFVKKEFEALTSDGTFERERITKIATHSDNAAQHFKSVKSLSWYTTLFDDYHHIDSLLWDFGAPGHGKGVWDGMFGMLKQWLRTRAIEAVTDAGVITTTSGTISTPFDCYEQWNAFFASDTWRQNHQDKKINEFQFFWAAPGVIERPTTDVVYEKVPGIQKSYQFVAVRNGVVLARRSSCWCDACARRTSALSSTGVVDGCVHATRPDAEQHEFQEHSVLEMSTAATGQRRLRSQTAGRGMAEKIAPWQWLLAQARDDPDDTLWLGRTVPLWEEGFEGQCRKKAVEEHVFQGVKFDKGDYMIAVQWYAVDAQDPDRRTFVEHTPHVDFLNSTELRLCGDGLEIDLVKGQKRSKRTARVNRRRATDERYDAVEAVLERARVWRLSRSYEDLALEACW